MPAYNTEEQRDSTGKVTAIRVFVDALGHRQYTDVPTTAAGAPASTVTATFAQLVDATAAQITANIVAKSNVTVDPRDHRGRNMSDSDVRSLAAQYGYKF